MICQDHVKEAQAPLTDLEGLNRMVSLLKNPEPDNAAWAKQLESYIRLLHARFADHASTVSRNEVEGVVEHFRVAFREAALQHPKYDREPIFYLGQLKSLLEIADRLVQRTIPEEAEIAARSSEVAKDALLALADVRRVTFSDLARRILVKPSNLSLVISELEREGLVRTREIGRTKEITLLPLGAAIAKIMLEEHPPGLRLLREVLARYPEKRKRRDA